MRRISLTLPRPLRRTCAAVLAAGALFALLAGGRSGAAERLLSTVGDDPAFLTAALSTQLRVSTPRAQDSLSGWDTLVLLQSPLLRSLSLRGGAAAVPGASPRPTPDGQVGRSHDDLTDAPISSAQPGNVVARTLIPTSDAGYLRTGSVYLYNRSNLDIDLPALAATPISIALPSEGPQVLIMHTHGTEAYTPDGEDTYQSTGDNCRTLDNGCNVVRIGDEIQRVLTEMGLTVLHDKTAYDYPQYNGAYGRSGKAVSEYLAEYPSIRIVLDVHRDALEDADGTVYKAVTQIDGVTCAQIELVLGSNELAEHDQFGANIALACRLQESMNTLYPTLARPMVLRSSRYNQELSTGSLLVEVGCHGNTLQESLAGARLFARAAGQVLLGLKA